MCSTEAGGLSLADPGFYAGGPPHAEFARLRRDDPVAWVEEPVTTLRSGDRDSVSTGAAVSGR